MNWFVFIPLLVVYVTVAIVLILVILLQAGKGGGLSSLGGGQAFSDAAGSTSAEKTMNRWTTYCAIAFGVLAITMTLIGSRFSESSSIVDDIEEPSAMTFPMGIPDGADSGVFPLTPAPDGESNAVPFQIDFSESTVEPTASESEEPDAPPSE